MRKYNEMLYLQHKMIYNHRKKNMFSPSVANRIERAVNMQCISRYLLYLLCKKYFKAN